MTTTMRIAFRIEPIAAAELRDVHRRGIDTFGNPVRRTVNLEAGGTPLRCCLTEAEIGDAVMLIAHRPFRTTGPYAEVGPVFVHADDCGGYTSPDAYPPGFRHRTQILRAYGHDGSIVDAQTVDGAAAETAIASLFERDEVAFIHSRNVLYGCYMFAIHRDSPGSCSRLA